MTAEKDEPACARCRKPPAICVCERIETHDTALSLLVLQHPQEDDAILGTVPLLAAALPKARVRVGLSWPNLEAALGDDVTVERARFAVLRPTPRPADLPPALAAAIAVVLDAKGALRASDAPAIAGVIALDGTWSQAKTLYWRNPWLSRLARVSLVPREPSMYGRLRKEPRREWVSTLEAVADTLSALGEDEAVRASLRRALRTMLQRVRDASASDGAAR